MSLSNDQLSKLSELIVDNIDIVFDHFDIDYKGEDRLYKKCPLHDGDNRNALNIYLHGNQLPFYYRCRTHQCEKVFKPTIIGFIRGLLSVKLKNWRKKGDETVSFPFTIDYICKLLEINPKDLNISGQESAKNTFMRQTGYLSDIPLPNKKPAKITREKVKTTLDIPSKYYLRRGFSREVLTKYDVGTCLNTNKEMFGRDVIPIYDENHKYLAGCSGRSIYEQCKHCQLYHPAGSCPRDATTINKSSKWRHSGFDSGSALFNIWFAKDFIKLNNNTAILVESPNNVLKIEQAGLKNSLAIFGTNLTDRHQFLLEKLGVMNLIVLMDNDDAGRIGKETIYKKCKYFYNLTFPEFDGNKNDIAEMTVEEIREFFQNI